MGSTAALEGFNIIERVLTEATCPGDVPGETMSAKQFKILKSHVNIYAEIPIKEMKPKWEITIYFAYKVNSLLYKTIRIFFLQLRQIYLWNSNYRNTETLQYS